MEKAFAWKGSPNIKNSLKRFVPVIIFICMFAVLAVYNTNFLRPQSIANLLMQVSAVGVVALGAMITLISGGIDFTAGYGLSLSGVAAGAIYGASGNNGVILILSAVAIGACVGLVNGVIITRLNLHPFIVTLAMMSVCQGMSTMIAEGKKIEITSEYLLELGSGKLFGFLPFSFLTLMLIAFLMGAVMHRTRIGVYTYAMGGNEDAVIYSGINEKVYKTLVYVIAGVCYGIGAILSVSQVTVITPNISGTYLLDGIAAAVIGGTSLSGGKGKISGVIIGAFIIILITTLLTFLGVPSLLRDAVKGAIIIGILLLDAFINGVSLREN